MSHPMQPKPTTFMGVEFRSRLEARWAVFFEAAGIAWNYEPRWITLPDGSYLPDFILPELHLVVEVKPTFQETAILRLASAVDVLNEPIWEMVDVPFFQGALLTQGDLTVPSQHSLHEGAWVTCGLEDDPDNPQKYWGRYWWCECPVCGKVGMTDRGWHGNLDCCRGDLHDYQTTEATPKLRAAYQAALRAFTRIG